MSDVFSITIWLIDVMAHSISYAIAGGMIVFAGYFFKEKKLKKKELSTFIQEIEDLAAHHWCSTNDDKNSRGISIQQKIHALGKKIGVNNKQKLSDPYREYRKAITSDNFDNPIVESPDKNSRVLLIREKSENLRKALGIKKNY